jgi:hypothetical protein
VLALRHADWVKLRLLQSQLKDFRYGPPWLPFLNLLQLREKDSELSRVVDAFAYISAAYVAAFTLDRRDVDRYCGACSVLRRDLSPVNRMAMRCYPTLEETQQYLYDCYEEMRSSFR